MQLCSFTPYPKIDFLINQQLTGVNVLNAKGTILRKISVIIMTDFHLGKHSFNLDSFLTYHSYSLFRRS